jgi:hypothetical protein
MLCFVQRGGLGLRYVQLERFVLARPTSIGCFGQGLQRCFGEGRIDIGAGLGLNPMRSCTHALNIGPSLPIPKARDLTPKTV